MAGINDRVQGFIESWGIVKENLEELIENERLFHSDRAGRSLPGESKDNLPEIMGQGNSGL